jgi:hypothetical protein
MFQPNRPSSGVEIVVVKESAAHCNAVFFSPLVVTSGYFQLCGLPSVLFVCPWVGLRTGRRDKSLRKVHNKKINNLYS